MEPSESSYCTLASLGQSSATEAKESCLKNNFMKLTEVLTERIKISFEVIEEKTNEN